MTPKKVGDLEGLGDWSPGVLDSRTSKERTPEGEGGVRDRDRSEITEGVVATPPPPSPIIHHIIDPSTAIVQKGREGAGPPVGVALDGSRWRAASTAGRASTTRSCSSRCGRSAAGRRGTTRRAAAGLWSRGHGEGVPLKHSNVIDNRRRGQRCSPASSHCRCPGPCPDTPTVPQQTREKAPSAMDPRCERVHTSSRRMQRFHFFLWTGRPVGRGPM